MIDHVSIAVADLPRAVAFYREVLKPLDYVLLIERDATAGFGKRYPEFWLNLRPGFVAHENPGMHVCLRTKSEASVERFHAAALEFGGRDAGEPGPRQAAMTTYCGAFILDPFGNKLEAVCFPKA